MKINQILAGAGFLALALIIGHSVSAADFKSFKDAPSEYTEDSPKSWAGPYIGIGAGVSSQDVEESHVEEYPYEPKYGHGAKGKGKHSKKFGVVTTTENEDDFLLFARIGNDWQRGPTVWGVFGGINYFGGGNDNDFGAEVGGRLGWLLTPAWLLYVNGGAEFGDDANPFVGGGMEWLLDRGWSMNIEPRVTFIDDNADNAVSARIGINRRF